MSGRKSHRGRGGSRRDSSGHGRTGSRPQSKQRKSSSAARSARGETSLPFRRFLAPVDSFAADTGVEGAGSRRAICVMSFNVLSHSSSAPYYFPWVRDRRHLAFFRRCPLIVRHIDELTPPPDFLALQELDHDGRDSVGPLWKQLGSSSLGGGARRMGAGGRPSSRSRGALCYETAFVQKQGKSHGCGVLYRGDRWRVESHEELGLDIPLHFHHVATKNVGQVLVVRERRSWVHQAQQQRDPNSAESGEPRADSQQKEGGGTLTEDGGPWFIVLANAHLYWKRDAAAESECEETVQSLQLNYVLQQARKAVDELRARSGVNANRVALVVCGDLNSPRHSHAVREVALGESHRERRARANDPQFSSGDIGVDVRISIEDASDQSLVGTENDFSQLAASTQGGDGVLREPALLSAYDLHPTREYNLCTQFKRDAGSDMVDHVFYSSDNLSVRRLLELPDISEVLIPNGAHGSDHLSLCVELELCDKPCA